MPRSESNNNCSHISQTACVNTATQSAVAVQYGMLYIRPNDDKQQTYMQRRIKGVLQHLGAQFWGPQLMGVENFYVLVMGL